MTRIAVVSDMHVPSRAAAIPDPVRDRIERADHTIHAGDFDSRATYETVLDLTDGDLTAVRGNTDPALDLPLVATVAFDGVTFVVTHGTGDKRHYDERVAGIVRDNHDGAIGIAGHTHEVRDEVVDGVRLLNPGSATGAAPATKPTMMTVVTEDGEAAVTVHED